MYYKNKNKNKNMKTMFQTKKKCLLLFIKSLTIMFSSTIVPLNIMVYFKGSRKKVRSLIQKSVNVSDYQSTLFRYFSYLFITAFLYANRANGQPCKVGVGSFTTYSLGYYKSSSQNGTDFLNLIF